MYNPKHRQSKKATKDNKSKSPSSLAPTGRRSGSPRSARSDDIGGNRGKIDEKYTIFLFNFICRRGSGFGKSIAGELGA